MNLSQIITPFIITIILTTAMIKRVNIFDEFYKGAMDSLKSAAELIPVLLLIVTAINMIYCSGALQSLSEALSGVLSKLGFPAEVLPLALIRPVSGSGALAVFDQILKENGADSLAGRTASVLMGSTETTIYTIAVYYSAIKMKSETKVFISSFTADLAGFIFSVLIVRIFYSITI